MVAWAVLVRFEWQYINDAWTGPANRQAAAEGRGPTMDLEQ